MEQEGVGEPAGGRSPVRPDAPATQQTIALRPASAADAASPRCLDQGSDDVEAPSTLAFAIESPSAHLQFRLSEARAAGRRRSALIQRPTLSVGLVLFIVPILVLIAVPTISRPATALLAELSNLLLLAAVLPTQPRVVRFANMVYCVRAALLAYTLAHITFIVDGVLTSALRCRALQHASNPPCWVYRAHLGENLLHVSVALLASGAAFVYLVRSSITPRTRINLIWRLFGMRTLFVGMSSLGFAIVLLLSGHWTQERSERSFVNILQVVIGFIVLRPNVRERVQAWLAKRGEGASSAAVLAAIFNGRPVDDIVHAAAGCFRCVQARRALTLMLRDEHSAASDAPAAVAPAEVEAPLHVRFALSQPAHFGGVDCFVCHSHHDDPHEKWGALASWCDAFRREHEREPLLWIDSFCLDTRRPDDVLPYLPVFVAGCTQLLVLRGPTTLQRLWCLVEIFSFLTMGGCPAAVSVVHVGGAAGSARPAAEPSQAESTPGESGVHVADAPVFSARAAECAFDMDRQLLLAVIEAYPGGISGFDDELHQICRGPAWLGDDDSGTEASNSLGRLVSSRQRTLAARPGAVATNLHGQLGGALVPSVVIHGRNDGRVSRTRVAPDVTPQCTQSSTSTAATPTDPVSGS